MLHSPPKSLHPSFLARLLIGLLSILPMTVATAGLVQGEIDGKAFVAPVECDFPTDSMFQARTPGMGYTSSNQSKVVPAVALQVWGGKLAVTAFVSDQRYQFVVNDIEIPMSKLEYRGRISSGKRGDYDVEFLVSCAP